MNWILKGAIIWALLVQIHGEVFDPKIQEIKVQYGIDSWQFRYASLHRSVLNGDIPPKYCIWTCGSSGRFKRKKLWYFCCF